MCRMALFINSSLQMGRNIPQKIWPTGRPAKIGFHHPQCWRNFQLCVRILRSSTMPCFRSWKTCPFPGQLLVSYVSYGLETAVGSL